MNVFKFFRRGGSAPVARERLQILLAMRKVRLTPAFFALLQNHTQKQLEHPFTASDYQHRVQTVWQRLTPAQMRDKAAAVQQIALDLPVN